jgi:hypothetical protein
MREEPAVTNLHHLTGRGPVKRLFPDRWYQRLSDSGSYTTWMTLTGHRHYASSGFATNWASPITSALADWNDYNIAPNTVYITDYAPASWHDVHQAVTDNCFTDFGVTRCTNGALGVVYLFDEVKHECPGGNCDALHSRPNTWWYALVLLDNNSHSGGFGTAWFRRATTAHELGHAIVLAHDYSPGNGEVSDDLCGTPRRTIMDGDCIFDEVLNRPQLWDSCGINHAYYQPSIGYAGC